MSSTRESLITAATELLDAGGAGNVTLREVGHRAGVSHNAPYKHFTDKESLLAVVAARELDQLREMMTATQADEVAPAEVLRRILIQYVDWALDRPARFRLVFGPWTQPNDTLSTSAEATWKLLIEATAAAQQAGTLPGTDPERMAALLRATTHGAVDLALTGHLVADGKGKATPALLVADLFDYLQS
ncbi:TetR/AcrR family transcriptional regulator [Kribbella sp. NBC_01505]|uniref:TetR/AcrR family transcriptional regulator n=1 Tax=Kribbella sp. NBC_01505 TaxID=2903580 RepID=UPI00386B5A32